MHLTTNMNIHVELDARLSSSSLLPTGAHSVAAAGLQETFPFNVTLSFSAVTFGCYSKEH